MDTTFSSTGTGTSNAAFSVHNELGTAREKLSDDPRARLMYYIYTISRILNLEGLDPALDRFRSFHDYLSITDKTVEALLDVANEFRPRLLLGKCLFVNNEMCRKAGFSTLTLPRIHSLEDLFDIQEHHVRLPTFGRVRVTKILVVKKSWLRYTFTHPYGTLERGMKNFYREEEEEEEEKMRIAFELVQRQDTPTSNCVCSIQ